MRPDQNTLIGKTSNDLSGNFVGVQGSQVAAGRMVDRGRGVSTGRGRGPAAGGGTSADRDASQSNVVAPTGGEDQRSAGKRKSREVV